MPNRFVSVALVTACLAWTVGCGGSADSANDPSGGGATVSTPAGRAVPDSTNTGPGSRDERTTRQSAIAIGVQPVPDTPIDSLPDHPGHEPLVESPAQDVEPLPVVPPPTREWFVSVKGSDTADGSEAAPFRTISKAITVVSPGEMIRVGAGTYPEKIILDSTVKAGRPDAKITIQGEGKPKIVPVTTGKDGMVQIRQPNWVVDGFDIDVKNQAQYGVEFSGNTSGSVIANSEIHHGSFGAGVTTYGNATGATIENNHIHHFSRGGVDSHGVVIQTTSKNITIRSNDIHNNSGDSVQCLGPEGFNNNAPADGLLIESNHLYSNRENGVDVKTCKNVTIRNNRIHGFKPTTTAKGDAVVIHYSAANITIEGNDIFDASKGIAIGGNHIGSVPKGVLIAKNRIHDITFAGGGEGTGIRLENSDGTRVLNNTVTRVEGTALILGHGTGGPTSNGVVRNNIFDGKVLVSLGNARPGLKMGANLYAKGSDKFETVDSLTGIDFGGWQGLGLDVSSVLADALVDVDDALKPGSEAVDRGEDVGLPYCGAAPDIGAVESGC